MPKYADGFFAPLKRFYSKFEFSGTRMGRLINVLVIEDSPADAGLILSVLEWSGYEPAFERVETAEAMSVAMMKQSWDVVICDYRMTRFSALAALSLLQKTGQDIPFIIVAHDGNMKNSLERLPAAVEHAIRETTTRQAQKQFHEALECLAFYHPFTHLPNRNLYNDRFRNAIQILRREGKPVAIIVMDLNRFCEVNATQWHSLGNLLLQQIGARLQEVLRGSDTVAHLGEDEFAVILPSTDVTGAVQVAQKVQQIMERSFMIAEISIRVESRMGIAVYPDDGKNVDDLMQKAYLAKETHSSDVVYTQEASKTK